jgi:hypothetical protein
VKKLLRCSVEKKFSVDFYVLADKDKDLKELKLGITDWMGLDPIDEWHGVYGEVSIDLDSRELSMAEALKRRLDVWEEDADEDEGYSLVDESDLKDIIEAAEEAAREAAELDAFNKKQLPLNIPPKVQKHVCTCQDCNGSWEQKIVYDAKLNITLEVNFPCPKCGKRLEPLK